MRVNIVWYFLISRMSCSLPVLQCAREKYGDNEQWTPKYWCYNSIYVGPSHAQLKNIMRPKYIVSCKIVIFVSYYLFLILWHDTFIFIYKVTFKNIWSFLWVKTSLLFVTAFQDYYFCFIRWIKTFFKVRTLISII